MKLNSLKFGLAAGITGSTIALVSSLIFKCLWLRRTDMAFQGAAQTMAQMQQTAQLLLPWGQIFINAIWVFVTYFFIGWCFSWVYNKLL
jgi:hypothetical protein